jgi:nicotinate-nucleotide adenylyltransferase
MNSPIGILGGTFDPVHNGHIELANYVLAKLNLKEVRFIPCYQPAHRDQPIASVKQRVHMLELALKNKPNLISDEREIKRKGMSYMIDTLQSLRQDFPNSPLCLIMGYDAYAKLNTWHRWQEILDYAHIIVINRTAYKMTPFLPENQTINPKDLYSNLNGKIYQLQMPPINISATKIRKKLTENKKLNGALPSSVSIYIIKNNLYKPPNQI